MEPTWLQSHAEEQIVFIDLILCRSIPLILTCAFREVVKTFSALIAMIATKVHFARTNSIHSLTVITNSSIQVTLAWPTIRVAKMTVRTRVAVGRAKLNAALAPARSFLTVSGWVEVVTVASWVREKKSNDWWFTWEGSPKLTLAYIGFIPVLAFRPIKRILTLVTIDTPSVMLTILTDTATLIPSMDVDRLVRGIDFFIVDASVRMAVTIAS
jgi:hypothetical protein